MIATRALTIQPAEQGGVLPKPWHLDQDGNVGRQDYWRGVPSRLIGFVERPVDESLDLWFGQFLENPKAAVGLFPVFEHADGAWHTYGGSLIAEVHDRTAAP